MFTLAHEHVYDVISTPLDNVHSNKLQQFIIVTNIMNTKYT